MTDKTLDTISWLLNCARRLGADACDAIMLETVDISTARRMGQPEGIERSENSIIGLRAFVGAQQAIVSATDTRQDSLTELAERAVAMAKASPPDSDSTLAPASLYAATIPDLDLCDDNEPDMVWLADQCRQAEETALATPDITNSEGADAQYSRNRISLGIHDGVSQRFAASYKSSYFSLSVSVLAGSGTGMERDYAFSTSRHRTGLAMPGSLGTEAAERALKRLNPRKITTCRVPIVFDPRVSRGLLSVLASAISGSAIARGSSFLKNSLGTQIFAPSIRIIDDPHIKAGLGSKPFDGEGVQNMRRALVENGELQSWLLDMRTANKLGLTTTGHASRGPSSPPSPSSTNLYMEKGVMTPEALIRQTHTGLYVTETFGMGINTVTGDYSQGAAGFWIENGEIAYPVSEITIAGHLSEMFAQATPANDLVFRYSTNAPTVRVDSMTVAGT